jgi:hypothetical protein
VAAEQLVSRIEHVRCRRIGRALARELVQSRWRLQGGERLLEAGEGGRGGGGGGARTAAITALECFLTIIRPRMVGSDLREARAAAASASAEGGEALEGAVAAERGVAREAAFASMRMRG